MEFLGRSRVGFKVGFGIVLFGGLCVIRLFNDEGKDGYGWCCLVFEFCMKGFCYSKYYDMYGFERMNFG